MLNIFRKRKYISSGSLSALTWKRFRKNRLSFFALIFICVASLIAILGYLITPDHSPYANEQYLELGLKKPGFTIEMLKIRKNEKEVNVGFFRKMIWGSRGNFDKVPFFRYYFDGGDIILEEYTGDEENNGALKAFHLVDILYAIPPDAEIQIIESNDTVFNFTDIEGNSIDVTMEILRESIIEDHIINRKFILGTDRYGRDVLSQLLIGTRVSLSVGFIAVFISLVVGIFLGSLAGFFRGRVDDFIVWFINVIWSIPTLLLVIAITFALGKGFWQVFVAVGLTMWVEVARVVRGQILSIREKEYIEAARALGFRNFRIIFRHILPNVMGAVIVISAANFATAILLEAGLSFLGIGVQPPVPSWGTMINENRGYIILDYAYLAILPGLCIMFMVLAFMLVGNGLRDALDVKIVRK